jgi:imidazolonepropionase-like amidohydrolase
MASKLQLMKTIALVLLSFLCLISSHAQVNAQTSSQSNTSPAAQVIESGKFRIYELKQVMGEESYEIGREPGGRELGGQSKSGRSSDGASKGRIIVTAKLDLPFWGEELKPLLNATLQMKPDLTPELFEIKGVRPLEVPIDTSVTVRGRTATVREGSASVRQGNANANAGNPAGATQIAVPGNFFTLAGYAPVTMEMMLVRYWLRHHLKGPLKLLPAGEAFIERRGRDTVTVNGESITLDRYHLSGSKWGGGWGRQTLWFDSENRLVAAVNLGTELETNFSAIRDGYDSALSFFLKRTVEDGIDRLTQVADRLSPKRKSPLVLLGATLIDGTGKPPIANSAVVIEGDRIVAVGPRSQIKIPAVATVVDASGKYLLPGLWDMHSHFYQVELGPAYLAAGITTARDVGNDIEFGTTMRDAAKQGRGLGPRMLLAGYINGKNDFHSFDVQVDTPAEARAAVQRYKNAGFEQIKIRDLVKLEILKVITAEAHRLGMTVTGHVPEGLNALQAVEAGMDQISHLNYVVTGFAPELPRGQPPLSIDFESPNSKQALRVFKEHGTVIDPTMAVLELMFRPKNMPIQTFEPGMAKVAPELIEQLEKKGAPAEEAEGIRLVMETLLKIIGALHRAGVPIVAGTDVGVPGHTLHRELELYVKAGLTPMEAIQAATLTPARVMKLENEVGTIEAGKRADIIILAANPLEDISNIRKVKFVVAQGRLFDCAKLWESVGFKP